MDRPQTRYATDLVLVPGFISNVEYGWEEPGLASFYRQLAFAVC